MITNENKTGYPSIDKPWMKYYSEEDKELIIPECSIYENMMNSSKSYSSSVCMEYMNIKIKYSKLYKMIDVVANALVNYGIKQGEIVSVCLPNIPEVAYVFYAINKIGAVANMLDPRSSEKQLEDALINSASRLLITIDIAIEKFNKIKSATNLNLIVTVSALTSLPKLVQKIAKLKDKSLAVKIDYETACMDWNGYLKVYGRKRKVPCAKYNKDAPAVIAYTGGTTGQSKGAVMTNRNLNSIIAMNEKMHFNVKPGDRNLVIAPPWTYYGLNNSLNADLCMGIISIMVPKLGADELGSLVYEKKPNQIITVPSALVGLMKEPLLEKEAMDYLKEIIVGADKLDETLENEFNAFLREHGCNIKLSKGYGMTEVTAAASYSKANSNDIGSSGIPYVGNIITAFTENESGDYIECKCGERGELAISGPSLMQGYFGVDEGETKNVLKKHSDGSLWVHTGDIGHIDSDGKVHVDGRIKRMFVKNGYKVFASEVEATILKHSLVENCAVISVPDSNSGLVAKAYIVLKKANVDKKVIHKEIIEQCTNDLFDYEIPDMIEFIDLMPLTGIGKIDYRKLEKMADEE